MDVDQEGAGAAQAAAAPAEETAEEKRLRRLERNRESARLSRLRKKQHLDSLALEVEALMEELSNGILATGKQAESIIRQKRKDLLLQAKAVIDARETMSTQTLSPDEEFLLQRTVEYCVNVAGPNSVERVCLRRGRFEALRRLLLGPATSIIALLAYSFTGALSTSDSEGSSSSSATSGAGTNKANLATVCNAWWASLCQEVPLSREQAESLRDSLCEAAKSQEAAIGSAKLDALLTLINKLETDLNESNRKAQDELEATAKVLDCRQMVKLLLWMYQLPLPSSSPSLLSTVESAGASSSSSSSAASFSMPSMMTSQREPLS
jgi:bZIP transcription factor